MKKALFFATALSVAMSSVAPIAFAASDSVNLQSDTIYGVPTEDNVETTIDIVTKWSDGSDYSSHAVANPLTAVVAENTETKKFDSMAYLDISSIAAKWDEYLDKAVEWAKGTGKFDSMTDAEIRSYAIDIAKFVGSYEITLTVDGEGASADNTLKGIENLMLQATNLEGFEWVDGDYTGADFFEFSNQSYIESDGKRIYSVEISVKDGVNEALDTYFKAVNNAADGKYDKLALSVSDSVVGTTGTTYEIKADVEGSVTIDLPQQDVALKIAGVSDNEYVALDMKEVAVPRPSESTESTEKPETIEDTVDVPVKDVLPTEVPSSVKVEEDSQETDADLVGFNIDVKKSDGTSAEYGTDYVAVYDGEVLSKSEYENIINGYDESVSAKDVIDKLSIRAKDGVTVKVAPTYQTETQKENDEWTVRNDYSGTGEAVVETEEPTATPTPTATATPTPTSTPGGNGGGSGSGGGSSTSGGSGSNQIAGSGNSGTSSVPGTSVETKIEFKDLDSVQWAVPAINTLVNLGVLNGRSDTEFDPNANVTRAEFTKMVCAAFAIAPTSTESHSFEDVRTTDWFYGYVQAAASRGIINGVSDTAFNPNATITRQEMAAILYRSIEATGAIDLLPKGTAIVFDDEADIADYAKMPVSTLSAAGVINGVTDTTFVPNAPATRAQAAAILYQYYKAAGTV